MNYKDQVQELRRRVPIPIQEAILRLRLSQGDMDIVEKEFIEDCITTICEQTNASRELAFTHFKEQKQDVAKAISLIREEEYDRNYVQTPGLTKEKLALVEKWLVIEDQEGLAYALGYLHFDSVIDTLSHMTALVDLVKALKTVNEQSQKIVDQYPNSDNIQSYIKGVNKFKATADYKRCEQLLMEKGNILDRELSRHARNIK
jgi:hypothetical protein